MKCLRIYLEELFANPANTVGMGNPVVSGDGMIDSDGLLAVAKKNKKIKNKKRKI